MRRLAVCCAVAVTIFTSFAALRSRHLGTVSAAASSNLAPLAAVRYEAGCPTGPGFTFCDRVPGTASPAAQFQIANFVAVTNVSASLAAVPGYTANFTAGDFTQTSSTCAGNLSAGQGCQIDVEFTPTTLGLREAALTVTDAAGDEVTFILLGKGADLALQPPAGFVGFDNTFSFPYTPVGSASVDYAFTISAASMETGITITFLPINGLASEYSAADFTIVGTTCTGSLNAGASCTVDIEYTPTTAGLRAAVLTATDANGDSTTLALEGLTSGNLIFGQDFSNPPACVVEQQAGFCAEPSGGVTPTNMYTIKNNSGTQITGLSFTPAIPTNPPTLPPTDFTVQSTTCTTTLQPNQVCTLNVAFTPLGTGVREGELTATDAQGDIAGFNLEGTGDNYQLQLASTQTPELTVEQGNTATWNAQLTADSVFGTRGEQVTLLCPTNLPQYSFCVFNPCPPKVTPNANTTFTIAITTASKTKPLPTTIPAACGSAAMAAPGVRGPDMIVQLGPQTVSGRARAPALAVLAAVSLAVGLMLLGFGSRLRRAWRVPLIFATAGIAAAIVFGCGGGSATTTGVTPISTTTMTIVGDALDANGNPINAARQMQVTLDVVKGK